MCGGSWADGKGRYGHTIFGMERIDWCSDYTPVYCVYNITDTLTYAVTFVFQRGSQWSSTPTAQRHTGPLPAVPSSDSRALSFSLHAAYLQGVLFILLRSLVASEIAGPKYTKRVTEHRPSFIIHRSY